ncbi:MAG: DNA mismatch repair protein MutS [Cytophagaceae bacterium]|nr:DNA mismatch repair protein MutS [Cytophagaceae bacterium]
MANTEQFRQRQARFGASEQGHQRRFNQLAVGRALLFLTGAFVTYFLAKTYTELPVIASPALLSFVAFVAAYLWVLTIHQRVRYQRNRTRFLKDLNADEAFRLEGTLTRPELGLEFEEPFHPYTADLDVFGSRSLFRLLNRTRTYTGAQTLATWLKTPASFSEIKARQQAIAELTPKLDWRQDTEATAAMQRSADAQSADAQSANQSTEALLDWASQPENPVVNQLWYRAARWVLPLLVFALVTAWFLEVVPFATLFVVLVFNGLVLGRLHSVVKQAVDQTYRVASAMRSAAAVLERLESESFGAEKLRHLQKQMADSPAAIRRLGRIVGALSYRQNPYFSLFIGLPTLWDVHYFAQLEHWKQHHRHDLANWLAVVGELEALNSLAGLAFAESEFVFPEIKTDGFDLKASALGHVLIPTEKRIANEFNFAGNGRTMLVTGSNMSGKSTFLRTLGTNTVLALAGSVVCARTMTCPLVQVFTSMRTQDSLEESTSSFYAELKRLRQLLELVRQGQNGLPVLYLLDEILKGTNSRDRNGGARALIHQLHETNASGLISTHDVELGDEAVAWDFVENYHFRSDLAPDGTLLFDYTLRPGVCHSFNASELMRQMGIRINAEF